MEKLMPRIGQMSDTLFRDDLLKIFTSIYQRMQSVCFTSAGLVISGTNTKVKTGASITYLVADGQIQSVAAATDMAVLAGSVTNAKFNVFVFSVDKAGNLYSNMGTEGGALNTVSWPKNIPTNRAILGYVIINPTGTGNFVGGTTPLGDATVVPNAVYVNTTGAFDAYSPLQ